jgi:hypothetical protein
VVNEATPPDRWLTAALVVLGFFAVDTLQDAPEISTAIIGIAALAVVLDLMWKRVRWDHRHGADR